MSVARTLPSLFAFSRLVHVRAASCAALAIVLLTRLAGAQTIAPPAAGSSPSSLPPAARAQMSATIGEDDPSYHARQQSGGFRMTNAGHGLTAVFSADGLELRQGTDHWALALRGYGYGERLVRAGSTAPRASANRIEYRRGPVTEWYLNGPLGLEQGFTLDRAPGSATDGALTLAFAHAGTLAPSVSGSGRDLTLSKDGVAAMRYAGLTAWDADRRELLSWLEVSEGEVRIRVDDRGARYPLTIDPFVQAARLTTAKPCDQSGVCDDGAPGDMFGWSVAISADAGTVVIGVPYKYTNSLATGAAYVFVRPSDFQGGWNSIYPIYYKAKLLASDTMSQGRQLGYSVDVSRDGSTIVAGALSGGQEGAAYVFVRPAFGWGTLPVQTQTAKLTALPSTNGLDYTSFGRSVTISGNGATIVVGAPEYHVDQVPRGAAFVYLRPAAGWTSGTETQKLIGSAGAGYTSSLSLSDDGSTLAVGAYAENGLGGTPNLVGAAYVLTRRTSAGQPDSYVQAARLVPSDGLLFDFFGTSIGVSGDGSTVVVGAPTNPYETESHPGAVYVFVRPNRGWGTPSFTTTQTARLTTTASWNEDRFGFAVDISADGRTIAAGGRDMPELPGTIPGPGVAYFYARPATGWVSSIENTKVRTPEGLLGDGFAFSAALSGDGKVSVIGAPREIVDASLAQGAAYVFTGSANDPIASVSPGNLAFAQAVGTTSNPKTVTLTNVGAGPLHVSSVAMIGPFAVTQNCVVASPIAPGASCSESVTFTPTSIGDVTGLVVFADDSGGVFETYQYVQLQGSGRKPKGAK